jgi:hypothetical protein
MIRKSLRHSYRVLDLIHHMKLFIADELLEWKLVADAFDEVRVVGILLQLEDAEDGVVSEVMPEV